MGKFGGKSWTGMPNHSLIKVSRRSGKGQIETGGKQQRKMNGKDEKSK
jgi:hypothetical protein